MIEYDDFRCPNSYLTAAARRGALGGGLLQLCR